MEKPHFQPPLQENEKAIIHDARLDKSNEWRE